MFICSIRRSACAALLALSVASPVWAGPAQETAITDRGTVVTTSRGECVRTKWRADSDPCAPAVIVPIAQKVAPQPAPEPVPQIALEQRTIYFEFNKSTLTPSARDKLDSLVEIVKKSTGINQVTVLGYADEIGKPEANLALSQRRADAAEQYLDERLTIPTDVRLVNGKGETDSVTDCPKTMKRAERIDCLARDRRVEVEFNYVHK